MQVKPQAEHQWLQRFVGDWTYETEADMGPGQGTATFRGTERVRSLGGLWIIGDGEGGMPGGGTGRTQIVLGYDPEKRRYVGTWVGSMMTQLWVYEGEVDAAGRVLTLNSEGPAMSGERKTDRYRDVFEIVSDDHRVMTSQVLGEDGTWRPFMTTHYRRTL